VEGDASGVTDEALEAVMATQKPGHCCSLVYTSGTTGPPKGVMISHDNMNWTVSVTQTTVHLGPGDLGVSYLPLSHVAATMIDIHGYLGIGFNMHFARPDALKGSLGETLKAVRPTFFLANYRFFFTPPVLPLSAIAFPNLHCHPSRRSPLMPLPLHRRLPTLPPLSVANSRSHGPKEGSVPPLPSK